MADKQTTYSVKFDISQARQQAQQLAASFRAELQNIKIQVLDPSAMAKDVQAVETLTREYAQLRSEIERTATASKQVQAAPQTPAATGGGLGNAIAGGIAGYLTLQSARQVVEQAAALDQMRTQAKSLDLALVQLAGGSDQAADAIKQIQSVAPGATNSLVAAQSATSILTQKLNSSALSLREISKYSVVVSQLSDSIHDQQGAISQLTLFSNSAGFQRADQLLANADAVKARIEDLKDQFPELSDAQLKAAATVQTVNEKFGSMADQLANNVSGWQKLTTAVEEFKIAAAKGPAGQAVDSLFGQWAELLGGQDITGARQRLERTRQNALDRNANIEKFGGGTTVDQSQPQKIDAYIERFDKLQAKFERMGPAGQAFIDSLESIATSVNRNQQVTEGDTAALDALEASYNKTTDAARNAALAAEDFNSKAYVEPKLEGVAALQDALERTRQLIANVGELGNVPGADKLQADVLKLADSLITSTSASDEQLTALSDLETQQTALSGAVDIYTTAAGGAAGASGSFAGSVRATIGPMTQMEAQAFNTADAVASLKGELAGLGTAIPLGKDLFSQYQNAILGASKKLIPISGASGATAYYNQYTGAGDQQQINRLAASGKSPAEIQIAIQAMIEANTASADAQVQAVKDAEAEQKRQAREAESNAKRLANDTKQAWKQAADAIEDKFKDMADKLKTKLESVPGLFGASEVTQGQMDIAKAGGANNFADNYVRRLRDEVKNKKDWEGVSIDQAREGLQKVGIALTGSIEGDLAKFEQAFYDSSLFADKSNIETFIDKNAVQDNLALQDKMEQGRQNILEAFGATIDAVTASVGDEEKDKMIQAKFDEIMAEKIANYSGGGGGGSSYTAPKPLFQPGAGASVPFGGGDFGFFGGFGAPQSFGPQPAAGAPSDVSGGKLTITELMVAQDAIDKFVADLGTQLGAQSETIKGQGASVGQLQDEGYIAFVHADLAGDLIADIAGQLAGQADLIKGQGTGIAAVQDSGYTTAPHGDLAGAYIGALAGQFQQDVNIKNVQAIGNNIAFDMASAMTAYDWTADSLTVMTNIRSGFATEEALDVILGTGGGIMYFLRDGMIRANEEDGFLKPLVDSMMAAMLSEVSASVNPQ